MKKLRFVTNCIFVRDYNIKQNKLNVLIWIIVYIKKKLVTKRTVVFVWIVFGFELVVLKE